MITRIQFTPQADEVKTKLVSRQQAENAQASMETAGQADFSKLLFDAFREQNRTFYRESTAAAGNASVDTAGGTPVTSLQGKKGVAVSNTELNRIFEEAAEKYQVPIALLKAVAKAESNFNPEDVSSSGAMGIMQLMPETAKGLGVTDPFDPEQNIMGGAKYLADKLAMYDGNVELALAAYNAGSGNVAKYGGVPPFEETKTYIKRVLSYMEEGNG